MTTTSSTQSQPKSSSLPPLNPSQNLDQEGWGPFSLHHALRVRGCNGCALGCQPNLEAPVVFRGNQYAKKMIIGEAPGKDEDRLGSPFVGPAGQLMDKILASQGWDSNKDWYIGNVMKCRPIAPPGTNKQNFTPGVECRRKCFPYIELEINDIKPHTIVLMGKSSVATFFPSLANVAMREIVGKIQHHAQWPDTVFFVMYHPASLLHAQRSPEKYQVLRKGTWEHIQLLRAIVDEAE